MKTKTFIQYSSNLFNISVKIGIFGNIRAKSSIDFRRKNIKKFRLFTIDENEYTIYINMSIKNDGTFLSRSFINFYNPHADKTKSKQYWKDNKEKIKKHQGKYREQNKDKIKEYNKTYYQNNKESCDDYNKEYKRNNKDKVKIWGARNNANRKGLGYNPINKSFKGSHFHHTFIDNDPDIGIHIPAKLHNSIWHDRDNVESMNKINKIAYEWLKNNKDC